LVGLIVFVSLYALVQLPFDCLGGYVLPRAHGRSHPPLAAFLRGLARGAATHTALLGVIACLATFAGGLLGVAGVVAAAAAAVVVLLAIRPRLASLVAPMTLTPSVPSGLEREVSLRVLLAETADEGFTGSVLGVVRATGHLLPGEWRRRVGIEGLQLALKRRSVAIRSGAWARGRVVAVVFTVTGVAVSAWLAGPERLGTAGGTVAVSLWFTLWSFLGLLTLPTISRRAVVEIDQRLLDRGCPPDLLDRTTRTLDSLQDDEPERPGLIESIFHPIPSVQNRIRGPKRVGVLGAWDAARTAVYLSASGVGLLGRAVHCNCGRPALWVFLPTD